jgi:hypothetical protein
MPGTNEELDDDAWEPPAAETAEESPNSQRMTIRVPELAVSPSQPPTVRPSQPPTVRPSQSQVDADELKPLDEVKPPEDAAPKA